MMSLVVVVAGDVCKPVLNFYHFAVSFALLLPQFAQLP